MPNDLLDALCQEAVIAYEGGGRPYIAFACATQEQAQAVASSMRARYPSVPCVFHGPPEWDHTERYRQTSIFEFLESTTAR